MNAFKTIIKRVVRKEHWCFMSWYRHHFGLLPTIWAYHYLLFHKGLSRAPNKFNGCPIFLRPGTADQEVYHQIFSKEDYRLNLGNPLNIVDAGAHIGISAVFFAYRYPEAKIIAIEPELSNFNLLLKNVRGYHNVKPVHAGLWNKNSFLTIEDTNVESWAFRVSEDLIEKKIPAISIRDILAVFDLANIDVLKMDIEGSEIEVLNSSDEWIDHVGTLIIELHDRFRPGCSEALRRALSGHSYEKYRSGENVVITRLKRMPS